MSEEPVKPDFLESEICTSGRHCMNCRLSPVRERWFEKYAVPDEIWDRCPKGKTMEQIREEHEIYKEEQRKVREEELRVEREIKADEAERIKQEGPMPPVAEQGLNFAKAVTRRAAAKVRREKVDVTDEVFEERMAICTTNKCGKYVKDKKGVERCGACGCPWKRKLRWATERCPLGYWENII